MGKRMNKDILESYEYWNLVKYIHALDDGKYYRIGKFCDECREYILNEMNLHIKHQDRFDYTLEDIKKMVLKDLGKIKIQKIISDYK